ncbi:MAG: 6-bladed beta-propeller [Candidatus Aminicenantes bacterium]|nr:MAG: 6-bladed beta-propeller [Candidatus Aminicenantes bacterium]
MKKLLFPVILLVLTVSLFPGIKNPDKPLKGVWDFKPHKAWEIENAGDKIIGKIGQIEVNQDERVYIFDRRGINYIFAKNGAFIKEFAKKGEGPGEIKKQRKLFCIKDMIIIVDNNKIHYFTREGIFVKSVRNDYYQRSPVVFLNKDEFISAVPTIYYKPDGKGIVTKYNVISGKETIITEYPLFKGGVTLIGKDTYFLWIAPELAPTMVLASDNDNRKLYYGMSDAYKINITDLNGKILDTFSVARQKKKISPRLKRQRFQPSTIPEFALKNLVNGYPDELTYFTRVEINNGMIYIYLSGVGSSYQNQQDIDIFSLDGKYQYRSCIKFDQDSAIIEAFFDRGILTRKDSLYVGLEDEEGNVKIAKYKIILPALPEK